MQALARKKRYEKQLTQIDGTLTTIEFQVEALENSSTNTEVLKAMQIAAKSLKSGHQDMLVFHYFKPILIYYIILLLSSFL